MAGKILLVDDDAVFRHELKSCLSEYEIIEAADGEEAVKLLKRPNTIDLAILDVKMPGPSGTEVLKEIKKFAPGLGIIILTAYSSEGVAIEALKAHADDYMDKCADIDEIKAAIARVMAGSKKRKPHGLSTNGGADKMEMAKGFIERNCLKKISLKDVAAEVALSPKYLSRVFRQAVGMGFEGYKLKLKMKEAKNFLKNTSYNINEISQKLQYENAESFMRAFKKFTGHTPTEYRRNIKKR